jgi:hypothetical protein
VAGFWAAVESIVSRHPEKVTRDGRHIVVGFLQVCDQETGTGEDVGSQTRLKAGAVK